MKKLLVIFVSFSSTVAFAQSKDTFMPDNDLWKQDSFEASNGGITQTVFNKIVAAGKKAYAENARQNNEALVINALWTDATVNANCCRGCEPGKVIVNMYGGLARRSEITPEGFALVLGHELSHAYGGAPYIEEAERMSAEGQADYQGARTAYKKLAALVPDLKKDISVDDSIKEFCKDKTGEDLKDCIHSLSGGMSLGKLLSTLSGDGPVSYQTPDPTVVDETLTSYPSTTQCRVDTYLAGTLNKDRPACWFKPTSFVPRWYY